MSRSFKKILLLEISIPILFLVGLYFYTQPQNQNINQADNCPITETIKTIRGNSMEPMLKEGEEIILLEGYYQCHLVQRGDIVAYDFAGNENPLIKKVRVVGGDELEFKGDNLLVHGEVLVNSRQEAYIFSEKQKKLIGLYLKKGKLVDDAYLIFGENIQSGLDSRKFGAVGSDNFLGKFDYEVK